MCSDLPELLAGATGARRQLCTPETCAATTGSVPTMKTITSYMSPMRRDERVGLYSCSCDRPYDSPCGCGRGPDRACVGVGFRSAHRLFRSGTTNDRGRRRTRARVSGLPPLNVGSAGNTFRYVPMMCERTPRSLSLLDRLSEIAADIFGRAALPVRAKGTQYHGGTAWHRDSERNIDSLGFAAYLEPLQRDTGALRVLPGSHRRSTADGPDGYPIAFEIAGEPVETDAGDVIVFDEHLLHASAGGTIRHQWRVDFFPDPQTSDETMTAEAFLGSRLPSRLGRRLRPRPLPELRHRLATIQPTCSTTATRTWGIPPRGRRRERRPRQPNNQLTVPCHGYAYSSCPTRNRSEQTQPADITEHASPNIAPGVSPIAGTEAFAIGDIDPRLLTTASLAVRHEGDGRTRSRRVLWESRTAPD